MNSKAAPPGTQGSQNKDGLIWGPAWQGMERGRAPHVQLIGTEPGLEARALSFRVDTMTLGWTCQEGVGPAGYRVLEGCCWTGHPRTGLG